MHAPSRYHASFWTAFSFLAMLSAFPAYAQGENCVGIGSDIERLQCFDRAFSSGSEVTAITPEDAVRKVANMVAFESSEYVFDLTYGEDPCEIMTISVGNHFDGLNHRKYQETSIADLSTVDRIGGWKKGFFSTRKGLSLIHRRGAEGVYIFRTLFHEGGKMDARDMNPDLMEGRSQESRGREEKFMLLVKEYFPDAEAVKEAMQVAINACQK